jgi:hypothetical protein
VAVDVDSIVRRVKAFTRDELKRTQERMAADMKQLDDRLQEAAELRARARGLRIFAEDLRRD